MRKTSWIITFIAVATAFVSSVFSLLRVDWFEYTQYSKRLADVTTFFGLAKTCELDDARLPGPRDNDLTYAIYQCRKFPAPISDRCENERRVFCSAWVTAGYAAELSASFSLISLLSILFGVSTRARRRRMWRAVAGLVLLQAALQIVAFAIVTDAYSRSRYPGFKHAQPGVAYMLGMLAWVIGVFTVVGVVGVGISAEKGYGWAAGNRVYHQVGGSSEDVEAL